MLYQAREFQKPLMSEEMSFCSLGNKLCSFLYVGLFFGPNSGLENVGINLSAIANASGVTLCFFYSD